jgi:squalene-hopene/tetraprenyl-beta-curcumene cyclase
MKSLCWMLSPALVVAFGALIALVPAGAADPPKADAATYDAVVDKAIAYLKKTQADDGSWSKDRNIGVTGVVLTGLLQSGKVKATDPMAEKALKFIESLVNVKEGHIAGPDPKAQLKNYVTSVNVMALTAANRDSYKAVIGDAVKFLKKLQWDDEEGKSPDNDFFGGAGYDSKSRPDLSNTQFFLDALKAAGVPKDDPAYKKALVFVSRCQNLKTEHNDQPWAGKINDGSFIYSAAEGGQSKADDKALPGYGSMTYAGIKSLIYCGVDKNDVRIQKAYEWLQKHYTLDANPGMPQARSKQGLYYYYATMAKCLEALGIDELEDAGKVKHNWRAELIATLAKQQKPDGSWVNEQEGWMEGDPNIVTAYALMALSHCKKK